MAEETVAAVRVVAGTTAVVTVVEGVEEEMAVAKVVAVTGAVEKVVEMGAVEMAAVGKAGARVVEKVVATAEVAKEPGTLSISALRILGQST